MASREVCDLLVKFYHERVQYIFPVLCWPVFYDQYSRIIAAPSPAKGSRLKSSEQIIRATINVLLAISASLRCFPGDALMSNSCFRRAQALVSVRLAVVRHCHLFPDARFSPSSQVPHLLLMGNVPIIQYLLLLCYHSQRYATIIPQQWLFDSLTHFLARTQLVQGQPLRERRRSVGCSSHPSTPRLTSLRLSLCKGLGLLMARGIQLNNQQVNETFSPQDQRVRERVWLLALQMESTVGLWQSSLPTDS